MSRTSQDAPTSSPRSSEQWTSYGATLSPALGDAGSVFVVTTGVTAGIDWVGARDAARQDGPVTKGTLAPNVTHTEGEPRFGRRGLCAPLCPHPVRGCQEMSPALPHPPNSACPSFQTPAAWRPRPVRRRVLRGMRRVCRVSPRKRCVACCLRRAPGQHEGHPQHHLPPCLPPPPGHLRPADGRGEVSRPGWHRRTGPIRPQSCPQIQRDM